MTEKRFKLEVENNMYYTIFDNQSTDEEDKLYGLDDEQICDLLNELADENEQLKKGMIEFVNKYIKNVECNSPSSERTYGKIKGALIHILEDLRSLIGDFE